MIDYFALLEEARRPWIDPERLKATFHKLSATLHPDRFHESPTETRLAATQSYTELNAAYRCLTDPKERLLHLLELESGHKPVEIQPIGDALMSLGMTVGQICRQVDQFLTEQGQPTSPLLQVQRFQKGQSWAGQLMDLQAQLNSRRQETWRDLEKMNAPWEAATLLPLSERSAALPLQELEEKYRLLSYYDRWIQQLQQRLAQLA